MHLCFQLAPIQGLVIHIQLSLDDEQSLMCNLRKCDVHECGCQRCRQMVESAPLEVVTCHVQFLIVSLITTSKQELIQCSTYVYLFVVFHISISVMNR